MDELDSPPHFELADLQRIDPALLLGRTKEETTGLQQLFLALALAYNDLKGLLLFSTWLNDFPAPQGVVTARNGQMGGLRIQIQRMAAGVAVEILKLLNEQSNTVNSEAFQKLVANIPEKARRSWAEIVAARSGNAAGTGTLEQLLVRIRSDLAYHYYQPKTLCNGYRHRFFTATKQPHNETAFVSLGGTMEETRFYYADAAAQAALEDVIGNDASKRLNDHLRALTFALGALIGEYLFEATNGEAVPWHRTRAVR